MNNTIFEDLFVLELANNHWGNVTRGKKIIKDFADVIHKHNVRTAIKLQFRDVDTFIHKDFLHRTDLRYINKTLQTKLDISAYKELVDYIQACGCITMSTPFDERSVELCKELDIEIIKIASSDINDWVLIEHIAQIKKPTIVSTGGSSLQDIDAIVEYFHERSIPLAINHCVSIYPCTKEELELNQIDFLRRRYPNHIIGFSTHEGNEDIAYAMLIAYAKGARTFERHIDIDADNIPVSPYCSLPSDINVWIQAYHQAKAICGSSSDHKRIPPEKEIRYLDALVRGAYVKRDLEQGAILTKDDIYFAIPLQKGQLSCREICYGESLIQSISKDAPLLLSDVEAPYSHDPQLQQTIANRGL